MATHHGNEGVVKVGNNVVAEITQWSIEETAEIADDTAMGDAWGTHLAGVKRWSGSLTCWWDETDTQGQGALTAGASVTLNLYPEGDDTGDAYFTGTATVTRVQRQASLTSIVTANIDVTGNGALTQSTVA